MSAVRAMPGTTPRNGLPWLKPYVYRGTGEDTLTPDMAVGPAPREFRRRVEDGRCTGCGYPVTSIGHRIECGDGS